MRDVVPELSLVIGTNYIFNIALVDFEGMI